MAPANGAADHGTQANVGAQRRPLVKSGLMLGLGESPEETREVMRDLRAAGVDILTLGQYLRPSRQHLPVVRHLPPEEFAQLRQEALAMGFAHVESGFISTESRPAAFILQSRPESRQVVGHDDDFNQ